MDGPGTLPEPASPAPAPVGARIQVASSVARLTGAEQQDLRARLAAPDRPAAALLLARPLVDAATGAPPEVVEVDRLLSTLLATGQTLDVRAWAVAAWCDTDRGSPPRPDGGHLALLRWVSEVVHRGGDVAVLAPAADRQPSDRALTLRLTGATGATGTPDAGGAGGVAETIGTTATGTEQRHGPALVELPSLRRGVDRTARLWTDPSVEVVVRGRSDGADEVAASVDHLLASLTDLRLRIVGPEGVHDHAVRARYLGDPRITVADPWRAERSAAPEVVALPAGVLVDAEVVERLRAVVRRRGVGLVQVSWPGAERAAGTVALLRAPAATAHRLAEADAEAIGRGDLDRDVLDRAGRIVGSWWVAPTEVGLPEPPTATAGDLLPPTAGRGPGHLDALARLQAEADRQYRAALAERDAREHALADAERLRDDLERTRQDLDRVRSRRALRAADRLGRLVRRR